MGDGQISAETTVKINGGAQPWGVGMRGEITLETVTKFQQPFCSIHQNVDIQNEECHRCTGHVRALAQQVVDESIIRCGNVSHVHECRCWIGHDCDSDPCEVQEELKRKSVDENGTPVEPNAMEVLGAEAPNRAMLGITQRIAALEKENESLRSVVQKLVGLLSEDTREAIGCTEILLGSPGGTSV